MAGGASAVFGEWGLSSDLVALGGIAVGVIGLVVQVVFKSLEYRLRLREHRKLMGRIE